MNKKDDSKEIKTSPEATAANSAEKKPPEKINIVVEEAGRPVTIPTASSEDEKAAPQPASPIIDQAKKKGLSNFWYLFLILGIAAVGLVVYFWISNQKTLRQIQEQEAETAPATESAEIQLGEDEILEQLQQQGDSDEIESIEEDLLSTDLSGLDRELGQIEEELSLP
jgi:uncharacterized protein HemX